MTQQLYPVFGVTPMMFFDHTKAGGGAGDYMPDNNDEQAESDSLTAGTLAPTEGWRVTEIRLMNTDTSNAGVVSMYVGTAYTARKFIGAISVPAKSGTDGTVVAVNGLSTTMFPSLPKDAAGNAYLEIPSGKTLYLISSLEAKLKSMVTRQTYAAPE